MLFESDIYTEKVQGLTKFLQKKHQAPLLPLPTSALLGIDSRPLQGYSSTLPLRDMPRPSLCS